MGPEFFQKSRITSKYQAPGWWLRTSSALSIHSAAVRCEPRRYIALSARCVCTYFGNVRGNTAGPCGFESRRGRGCVCCECCVLSGRGLCDELITRLEESYRLWCVVVCDWSRNLTIEEVLAHWWLLLQRGESGDTAVIILKMFRSAV